MATKDLRTNDHGVNVNDMIPGHWVVIEWSDIGRQVELLVDVEKRLPTFKGYRDIGVVSCANGTWRHSTNAQHDMVVAVFDSIERMTYRDALKHAKRYLK